MLLVQQAQKHSKFCLENNGTPMSQAVTVASNPISVKESSGGGGETGM